MKLRVDVGALLKIAGRRMKRKQEKRVRIAQVGATKNIGRREVGTASEIAQRRIAFLRGLHVQQQPKVRIPSEKKGYSLRRNRNQRRARWQHANPLRPQHVSVASQHGIREVPVASRKSLCDSTETSRGAALLRKCDAFARNPRRRKLAPRISLLFPLKKAVENAQK